jgi:hypothetical protein
VWVNTRFHLPILHLEAGGGTLVLVGSHYQKPGVRLRVGVCCPFGLPKKILELLGKIGGFSYDDLLVGYIANIRIPAQDKKLKPIFFIQSANLFTLWQDRR